MPIRLGPAQGAELEGAPWRLELCPNCGCLPRLGSTRAPGLVILRRQVDGVKELVAPVEARRRAPSRCQPELPRKACLPGAPLSGGGGALGGCDCRDPDWRRRRPASRTG